MYQFRKRLLIAVLVVVIMPLSTAQAKPFGFGPAFGPGGGAKGDAGMLGPGPAIMSDLNLTTEQIDLLKKNKIEKRKTMVKLQSDLRLLRIDLAEAASQDNPNMRKIEVMSRKVGDIHGQMTAERTKSIVYLRSILTDEQRKIMDSRRVGSGFMNGKAMGRFCR